MTLELAPLPYPADSLAPHISERTMSFHYGRHHAGYVANLNKLIANTVHEQASIEQILAAAEAGTALFNNAAQAWNHAFYWQSMSPDGGGSPAGELAAAIDANFGSLDSFVEDFASAAVSNFGSGWTWLVVNRTDGSLSISNTDDADTPLVHGLTPLLTIDVWEHAYYLDYQNARAAYVDTFIEHLLNWEFVAQNLAAANRA